MLPDSNPEQERATHIPDGFIDAKTAIATAALAAAGVGLALREVRRRLPPSQVPLIGLTAAFVFAAQMLNFPVAGGTSGHLIGATLATVLLGPSAATLAMTSVLILQCFMFADGGLTALGANVFNMAVFAPWVAYAVGGLVRRVSGGGLRGRLTAAFVAAWASTVATSISCAGQLALSGTVAWSAAFPAMATIHMLIGLGEGLITALTLAAIASVRPELVLDTGPTVIRPARRELVAYGVLVVLGLAVFVAPFASAWPDGLEKVAETLGFEHKTTPAVLPAPLSDYAVPGVGSAVRSTMIAGAVGTITVFVLAHLTATWLTRRQAAVSSEPRHESAST